MSLPQAWRRLVHLVRGGAAADDLRAEMQLHVELRARANRGAGMSDAEAREAARRQFGNETALRETSRDQWGFAWVEHAARDVRYAARRLVQRPGFSGAVIGVLALGIGATTAMFSAVDAAMFRPLPFADPSRLVALRSISVPFDPGPGQPHGGGVQAVSIVDIREMRDVFSHAAVYAAGGLNLADAAHPVRAKAGVVTGDFFATLGAVPLVGRTFTESDGVPNGPNIVILSYGLWQRQYGGGEMLGTIHHAQQSAVPGRGRDAQRFRLSVGKRPVDSHVDPEHVRHVLGVPGIPSHVDRRAAGAGSRRRRRVDTTDGVVGSTRRAGDSPTRSATIPQRAGAALEVDGSADDAAARADR